MNFETMVFFSPTPIYKMIRCISKDKAVVSIQMLVPNLPGEIHASATTRDLAGQHWQSLELYEDNSFSTLLASCQLENELKTIQL